MVGASRTPSNLAFLGSLAVELGSTQQMITGPSWTLQDPLCPSPAPRERGKETKVKIKLWAAGLPPSLGCHPGIAWVGREGSSGLTWGLTLGLSMSFKQPRPGLCPALSSWPQKQGLAWGPHVPLPQTVDSSPSRRKWSGEGGESTPEHNQGDRGLLGPNLPSGGKVFLGANLRAEGASEEDGGRKRGRESGQSGTVAWLALKGRFITDLNSAIPWHRFSQDNVTRSYLICSKNDTVSPSPDIFNAFQTMVGLGPRDTP